jgi:hypothetical protein
MKLRVFIKAVGIGPHRHFNRHQMAAKSRLFFDKGGYARASIISRDDPSKFGLLEEGQVKRPILSRPVPLHLSPHEAG